MRRFCVKYAVSKAKNAFPRSEQKPHKNINIDLLAKKNSGTVNSRGKPHTEQRIKQTVKQNIESRAPRHSKQRTLNRGLEFFLRVVRQGSEQRLRYNHRNFSDSLP